MSRFVSVFNSIPYIYIHVLRCYVSLVLTMCSAGLLYMYVVKGYYRGGFSLNPLPHTTILQQTSLNIFCQKIENLYN